MIDPKRLPFRKTPDARSQALTAIPLIGLYELSILLSKIFGKKKKKESSESA